MFCGTGNLKHIDHEDTNTSAVPVSSSPLPPVVKGSRKKANKNPYSTRGLDKFSTVLSELESKKEKIMSKAGSRGVAMVRFAYSSSHDSWVPIVVRIRDCKERDKKKVSETVGEASAAIGEEKMVLDKEEEGERVVKKSFSWGRYYWPMVVVLILVCLVLYGRVFAICCTTVLWYLVPGTMKKKDYGKRVVEGKKLMMVDADK
ncbi:uncharacterized protein LOC109721657 [Ananas comosus]|uniref:Uncharacterized protein LOC109721657 n=1 Tax=Ananas comosus TaxID=4615 RepID=A0A6P5G9Q8_ANACO|nr:uncharacterized protein LOC109721657 [Ananas comosus]